MRRHFLPLALLVLAALAVAAWRFHDRKGAEPGAFLGYVEGDLLFVAPVEGERLVRLDVEVGKAVEPGDPLFTVATPLLDEQRDEAVARLEQMKAQLENLRAAMNRPQQIAVLQAAVDRAMAALRLSTSEYERKKTLYARGSATKAALDQAQMALERDRATLEEAKRQVEAARIPSRSHEIEAAEAAIQQVRSQIDQIDIRIKRQHVVAPVAGIVQDIYFRVGEMVNAGQPALSLLPPENRKVRFYVPQQQLASVRLGAKVRISCDGCKGGLWGRIVFVSSREEYTPPVIFSDQERAKLVFKIEARLEDDARNLPLGLPVAVRLWPDDQSAGS
jgi:HlyD family secretion protein